MPEAWEKSTGEGAVVAVLDTGVAFEDCSSADCGDRYYQAPDFGGTSFVDPRDLANNDDHPNDENGHGTHVASTIVEATNNATGAAGVAFDAALMPLRVCGDDGTCRVSDIVDGIRWAVDHGADVINLSLGGGGSFVERRTVNDAVDAGVVVVAAAGNGGDDGIGDPDLDCPACYPATIAVGATRFDGALAPYSNYGDGYGDHTLDLVAPGGDLDEDQDEDGHPDGVLQQSLRHFCTTDPVDFGEFGYCFANGTSMAAPHVAGVAALLLSVNPALTPEQVRDILTATAQDLGPHGYDLEFGHGRVDAAAALAAAQTSLSTPTPADTPTATATPTLPSTPTATPTPTYTPTPTDTPTPTPTPPFAGDANCDASVNAIDAALVLQFNAGLLAALAV
jgi:serine protease